MLRLLHLLIALATISVLIIFLGCENDPLSSVIESEEPIDSSNNARLTIDNSTFDFGFVPQHSKISHGFWLKSSGTDTLRILNIQPG